MCAGSRNCIAQSGTTRRLDAISDRLMYRLQYRNIGGHQMMLCKSTVDVTGTNRAGIRWYELRNTGSGWSIFQQGTFSPDATARWMGSIAMDVNGNIGLGYSASSSSMFPAIRYTGRLAADAAGTMTQGEGVIINGTGAQTHSASHWGDYSSLSVDPVDGWLFWYTNEYVQATGLSPSRLASVHSNCQVAAAADQLPHRQLFLHPQHRRIPRCIQPQQIHRFLAPRVQVSSTQAPTQPKQAATVMATRRIQPTVIQITAHLLWILIAARTRIHPAQTAARISVASPTMGSAYPARPS